MLQRNSRDITCGLLLTLVGLAVALYAANNYTVGTFRQMGSGMFPVLMGILLAVLGILIALPAFFQEGEARSFELKSFIIITSSLVAFPVLLTFAGLVPAVIATTVISGSADKSSTIYGKLILGIVLSAMSYVIFVLGLQLPLVAFGRAI